MPKTQAAELLRWVLFVVFPSKMPEGQLFEVHDLPDAYAERRDASMALNDMLTLIAVIFTFAGLLVNIVNTTFNITWKIAHEHKDEDSKKSE